jgi:hypothetical protein
MAAEPEKPATCHPTPPSGIASPTLGPTASSVTVSILKKMPDVNADSSMPGLK